MGKNYLKRLFTLHLNPNAAARGQHYKCGSIRSVRAFDPSRISTTNLVLTLLICGLNKRWHFNETSKHEGSNFWDHLKEKGIYEEVQELAEEIYGHFYQKGAASMNSVFISYIRENQEAVNRLYRELKSRGINVWMAEHDLQPGDRWEHKIRQAIQEGTFFIPCFSKEYKDRDKTYMNAELDVAIDVLKELSLDETWCIPVKLNECEIPANKIGRGDTLRSLQYVDLSENENWDIGIQRIRQVIQSKSIDTTAVNQDNPGAVEAFSRGVSCQNSARESTNPEVKQEEYKSAIIHYTSAIQLQPDYAEAYKNRGDTYQEQGQADAALTDYNIAIQLQPDYAEAYKNRGSIYHEKDEAHKAIQDYTEVITLQPDDAKTYNDRGEVYREQGNFDQAIEDYNIAIGINPDYAEAYDNRGEAYRGKGEMYKAWRDHSKAIELNPDYAKAYNRRGDFFHGQGELDLAITDYSKAIELEPDFAPPYNNRANAYNAKRTFDLAIEDYNTMIKLKPGSHQPYNGRGNAYRGKGEVDRAIQDYNKAIELKPDYPTVYNSIGEAYREKGEIDQAIEYYNKAIQLNPAKPSPYNNRGIAYRRKCQFNRAIEDYNKAIELKPRYPEAYNNRGNVYLSNKKFALAIEDYNKAIELKPDYSEAYQNRGEAYHGQDQFPRAIDSYTKAIAFNPDYPEAYYNRSVTWLCLQEWEIAEADLSHAAQMGIDIIGRFNHEHISIGDFEEKCGIKLPENIKTMLR